MPIAQRVGCSACDYAGFAGRVLAAESLTIDRAVAAELTAGRSTRGELAACLTEKNYNSLELSLDALLRSGKISREQFSLYAEIDGPEQN